MMRYLLIISLLISLQLQGQTDSSKLHSFPVLPNPTMAESDAESLMKEAIGHYDGGRYRSAVQLLDRAMEVNQQGRLSDILYYYKAMATLQLDQKQKALALLDTAILFQDQKAHYYFHRGTIHQQNGSAQLAYQDFQKAIELRPSYEAAWLNSGLILQQQNQLRQALIAYNKTLGINPKNAKAYYYRGLIMLQVGMPQDGCLDLQKAADLGLREADKAQVQYCD